FGPSVDDVIAGTGIDPPGPSIDVDHVIPASAFDRFCRGVGDDQVVAGSSSHRPAGVRCRRSRGAMADRRKAQRPDEDTGEQSQAERKAGTLTDWMRHASSSRVVIRLVARALLHALPGDLLPEDF